MLSHVPVSSCEKCVCMFMFRDDATNIFVFLLCVKDVGASPSGVATLRASPIGSVLRTSPSVGLRGVGRNNKKSHNPLEAVAWW